jgi:formylglycine-generating enzyme required for sulfatase activity
MRKKALKNAVRRVLRGGSYYYGTFILHTTVRDWNKPEDRYWFNGFRLIARKVG